MNSYKIFFCAVMMLCFSIKSYAQINIGGSPYAWDNTFKTDADIPIVRMPLLDMQKIKDEDEADEQTGLPPRFGYKHEVTLTLDNSGIWTELEDGSRLWQLEIHCPNAQSVNLTFSKFRLPEKGVMYVYSKDKKHSIGGFTHQNNKGTDANPRGFATGLVFSERIIIEYFEPVESKSKSIINISGIVHGYRSMKPAPKANKVDDFGDSGNCQVNVNCNPEGNNWQDEKRGVAFFMVGGVRWCSGSLINNANNDGDLLFLTANHCLDTDGDGIINFDAEGNTDLSTFSFIWNYESANCANPQNEPQQFTSNGAVLLANNNASDFALFRLTESPLALQMPQPVFFNGWDRTNNPPAGGVGIHHPRGDIKKISTYNITPIGNSNCSQTPANYWEINWQTTPNGFSVQQPGSSGSPLFSANSRIIGQLFGPMQCGLQQCDEPANQEVVYGRLSVSWNNGQQATRRLRDWLDPINTDAQQIEGGYFDACVETLVINAPINNGGEFQAENIIQASSVINATAQVEMVAGQMVELLPGFQTQAGAFLEARIGNCIPRVIPPANKNIPNETYENAVASSIQYYLNIFPNPTSQKLNIEYTLGENETAEISIFDAVGNQVFNKKVSDIQILEADVSSLSSGLYILNFQTGKHKQHKRFVISK